MKATGSPTWCTAPSASTGCGGSARSVPSRFCSGVVQGRMPNPAGFRSAPVWPGALALLPGRLVWPGALPLLPGEVDEPSDPLEPLIPVPLLPSEPVVEPSVLPAVEPVRPTVLPGDPAVLPALLPTDPAV